MTIEEKMAKCSEFFCKLAEELRDSYEVLESCNADFSKYLVPNGTSDQVTYEGKPDKSFRISDHWNWYANVRKCPNPNYIQCLSVDLPWARKRMEEGRPSKPITGVQIALIGDDGKYHVVYGECYNRKTKEWSWVENNPKEVAEMVLV